LKLIEIAKILDAVLVSKDENKEILHIKALEDATSDDIGFLSNEKYLDYAINTKAFAVIVDEKHYEMLKEKREDLSFLIVKNPYLSFSKLVKFFDNSPEVQRTISDKAYIDDTAVIGRNVGIYPGVYIGRNVIIGDNSVIYPNCTIEDRVRIGKDSILYSNVVVRYDCKIGDNVIIHSGTVIGSDGFGFAPDEHMVFHKILQIGNVIIENNVEIGSNVSIDRAALGSTIIGEGVKLDNLIQVGHNVVIGKNTVIAAQTGISGSTKIGNYNMIGGQVGFVGHIKTGDLVQVGAQSGVTKNIPDKSTYFGTPARPIKEIAKIEAILVRLPRMYKVLRKLLRKFNLKIED